MNIGNVFVYSHESNEGISRPIVQLLHNHIVVIVVITTTTMCLAYQASRHLHRCYSKKLTKKSSRANSALEE